MRPRWKRSFLAAQRMGPSRRGHRSRGRFHRIRASLLPGHPIRGVLRRRFDIIYMLNAFYAFDAQREALAALRQVAEAGARLVIFDYLDRGGLASDPLVVNVAKIVPHPIEMSRIPDDLTAAGWKLDSAEELNEPYRRWYADLVARIERKRAEIVALGAKMPSPTCSRCMAECS